MFCPKCSQQQISDETRFCSRCGFELNVVKALLASDISPQTAETQKPDRSLSKRDMTIGAALMFVFAFIVAAITVESPPASSIPIVFLIIAWFALSLLINIKPMIQYFLRGDASAQAADDFSASKAVLKFTSRNKKALPESHSIPVEDFVMPSANTAEMVQPRSVTEETTNLLNK